jgi:flagellar hook-basal body complex protein FliE
MPIDPSFLTKGAEWSVGGVGGAGGAGSASGTASATGGQGFGQMLANQVGQLSDLQDNAAQASQALATGQATDPTQVVMDVERARLSMQLASQIRTKALEAVNDVFHTQV